MSGIIEITRHAITRYIERIDPQADEYTANGILYQALKAEKDADIKRKTATYRMVEDRSKRFWYLGCNSPSGKRFFIAIDPTGSLAKTVLTVEWFSQLCTNKLPARYKP